MIGRSAVAQLVHAAGVGAAPHVAQLAGLQRIPQGSCHVLGDARGTLDVQCAQIETAGGEAPRTRLLVILPGHTGVCGAFKGTPIMHQQGYVVAGVH